MRIVYRYRLNAVFLPYFSMGGMLLLSSWLIYASATSPSTAKSFGEMPIGVHLLLIAAPLIALAGLLGSVAIFRPVSIDENGIRTYLLGRVFKSIAWSDIQRIEKRRSYDNLNERYRFVYHILTLERTIRFQEGLCDLGKLLEGINQYIQQFNIETVLVDLGRDTLHAALSSTTDSAKRREFRRRGVRTQISAL